MRTGIGIHQLIIHGPDKGRAIKEPNATTKKKSPPQKVLLTALKRMDTTQEDGRPLRPCETEFLIMTYLKSSKVCGDTDPLTPRAAGHSLRQLGDTSVLNKC